MQHLLLVMAKLLDLAGPQRAISRHLHMAGRQTGMRTIQFMHFLVLDTGRATGKAARRCAAVVSGSSTKPLDFVIKACADTVDGSN